ncbi:MAG: hypothetical protein Q9160_008871 [Pyrenula sp. 1 TL-2023]
MAVTNGPSRDNFVDTNRRPSSVGDSTIFDGEIPLTKAETFLQKQGASIHPIFAPDGTEPQQEDVTPMGNAFNQSAELHTEQFLKVMESYKASMKDPSVSVLNLREKHSWADVLQAAQDAEAVYVQAGKKGLRKTGRVLATKSEAALPFVRLIPNENCLSVLCGGLKIVFEAASRISERRDQVLKALLRIPNVISLAQESMENFPSDTALYNKASALYLAALAAIEGTTKWLMKDPSWKYPRSLLLGSLYNRSFKEKLQTLDEALNTLEERVSILRDGAIVSAKRIIGGVETVVRRIQKTGEVVDTTTKSTLQHVQDTDAKVASITEGIESIAKSQDETHVKIDHLSDLQQAKEEANRAMKTVLEETTKTSEWMRKKDRDISRLKKQVEVLERAAIALTSDDLLDLLGVSADSPIQDLRRVNRLRKSSELSASHIAKGVCESPKFREWQSKDVSSILFIEGSSPSIIRTRSSSVSHISTSVIEHFQDREPAVAIHFLCGFHTSLNDRESGPHGMMRSLICQLLRLFSPRLDFISSRRYRDQLEALSFHTLLDCFRKLVRRLPVTTVLFCVVDSVNFFEREWTEDCRNAIRDLQDLADDEGLGAIIKLLITSSSRSRSIRDIVPPSCRLLLPNDNVNGRDGPTKRQISIGARRLSIRANDSETMSPLQRRSCADSDEEDLTDLFSESDDSFVSDAMY